jgi:phage terminase large subunit
MSMQINIITPAWAERLEEPWPHTVVYGGRGGGKSYAVADRLIEEAFQEPLNVLCAREFQNSIQDSVLPLLMMRIKRMGLEWFFKATKNNIVGINGSKFFFRGISRNPESVKGIPALQRVWVEEAQTISRESLDILIPTMRPEVGFIGSIDNIKAYYTMNPMLETDPVYKDFIANSRDDCLVMKINYSENPFFNPDPANPSQLEKERLHKRKVDPDGYRNVWEGECVKHTDAQIFKGKWHIEDFTPTEAWNAPLYGLDWGFSQDPTACVKVYVHDQTLYIEKEAVKVGLELDDTASFILGKMPEIKDAVIRADNARPESIKHVSQDGRLHNGGRITRGCLPRIKPCIKWKGSVEDGITHMRSYNRIVVHPRCSEAIKELTLYSYKVDKRTNDVLRDVVDSNNHVIDAIRYAIEPLIERKFSILDAF